MNLYVSGPGQRGRQAAGPAGRSSRTCSEQLGLQVRVVAIANRRHCIVDENGLDLAAWPAALAAAGALHAGGVHRAHREPQPAQLHSGGRDGQPRRRRPLRRPARKERGRGGVQQSGRARRPTPTTPGCKGLAQDFNTSFLFETNVGAGLPIIGTLGDLAAQRRRGAPSWKPCSRARSTSCSTTTTAAGPLPRWCARPRPRATPSPTRAST
ncbi:MAG: hypothetical protein WKG07_29570 [Hymenobacter sp.]